LPAIARPSWSGSECHQGADRSTLGNAIYDACHAALPGDDARGQGLRRPQTPFQKERAGNSDEVINFRTSLSCACYAAAMRTRKIISLSLSDDTIERIDRLAEWTGKSRSECVEQYLSLYAPALSDPLPNDIRAPERREAA
jgi:hypothetical protein